MDYDTEYTFAEVDNLPELEELQDWALENPSQDIRNRPLVTAEGQTLGIIDDMLVDRSSERVSAVRLEDGRIAPAENLEIYADRVIYQPAGATTAYVAEARETDATIDADADETIQIVEEEVAIGKRAVAGDAIRVTSKVVTDVVTEDVALRKEEVYVQTNPTERVVSTADADELFEEKVIEVAEVNEEAVVGKRAVVTGEVEVGKVTDTEIETVSETARRTVVDVDTDVDVDATVVATDLDKRNA
ncbi:YsnF/AvaK domain-containing protein [uncultured Algimonas sp.]|uniref:YsnF/AvaK domain-containing protein n=1 Tax=uncultured Algimonas sp. TaxID=1547920 RepID=UPI002601A534|nr:YsnF/AvaK domain-containing protein [uncultured Algimonas sp.]